MISDKIVFKRDEVVVKIPVLNSAQIDNFILDMNFSLQFVIRMNIALDEFRNEKDEWKRLDILKNIAVDILNLDKDKHITILDVENKYNSYSILYYLFNLCISKLSSLSPDGLFSVPDIKLKDSKEPSIAERKVNEMTDDFDFMESITLVMQETGNSFYQVLFMPYTAFQGTLKHIRIGKYMQNDEWREAYFKERYKLELKKEYKKSDAKNQHQSIDLNRLKRLGDLING